MISVILSCTMILELPPLLDKQVDDELLTDYFKSLLQKPVASKKVPSSISSSDVY